MKRIIHFLCFFCLVFLLAFQCDKENMGSSECIEAKIPSFANQACSNGANVLLYYYQENRVYVFNYGPYFVDMTATVLSEECDTMGYLGGLMGNSQINGADFSSAELMDTIWRN